MTRLPHPSIIWAFIYWGAMAFAIPAFLLLMALVAFTFHDMLSAP